MKQMKYFQTVIQCGSFTEAAKECCISQSALSQQIQALEQKLGVELLERRKRRVRVTPAGEYFYQKSVVLTEDIEKLCRMTVQIAYGKAEQACAGRLKGNKMMHADIQR